MRSRQELKHLLHQDGPMGNLGEAGLIRWWRTKAGESADKTSRALHLQTARH